MLVESLQGGVTLSDLSFIKVTLDALRRKDYRGLEWKQHELLGSLSNGVGERE